MSNGYCQACEDRYSNCTCDDRYTAEELNECDERLQREGEPKPMSTRREWTLGEHDEYWGVARLLSGPEITSDVRVIEASPETALAHEMRGVLAELGAMRGQLMSLADMEGRVCKLADKANALLAKLSQSRSQAEGGGSYE